MLIKLQGYKVIVPVQSNVNMQNPKMIMAVVLALLVCILLLSAKELNTWVQEAGPLKLALPHQPIRFVMVTALYNLHRTDRDFKSEYMPWFSTTLRKFSKCAHQIVVFCNDRAVADRARESAANAIVVIEENYPLHGMVDEVKPILRKMAPTQNPWNQEFNNKDYILLQFSKFIWLQKAVDLLSKEGAEGDESFFWVDAGISRFLLFGQEYANFPLLLKPGLVSVQSAMKTVPKNATSVGDCMGCLRNIFRGTLFGSGSREALSWLKDGMLKVLKEDFIGKGIMDNEQAGIALLYSRFPERFNLLFQEDFVGREASSSCNFICI